MGKPTPSSGFSMGLKTFLNKNFFVVCGRIVCAAAWLGLSACATIPPAPPPPPETGLPAPEMVEPPDTAGQIPDSRMVASHSLTREGHRLLAENNFDGAIRVLERAVGLNPADGPGYYYLAEAWLGKNNPALAAQFNRLARLYLRDDPAWSGRAEAQKNRIESAGEAP